MKQKVNIITPKGIGSIENMYVTELGFLMIRVYISEDTRWISYNLGKHDVNNNFFLKIILPTTWLYQYLDTEHLWYLTHHHPIDGILEEQFFDTEEKLLTYVAEHNIILENEKLN